MALPKVGPGGGGVGPTGGVGGSVWEDDAWDVDAWDVDAWETYGISLGGGVGPHAGLLALLALDNHVYLEMELNGRFNGWTIIEDALIDTISFERGLPGGGIADCVTSADTLRFSLNNARIIGQYSPDHASCRAGFGESIGVRLRYDIQGVDRIRFTGTIEHIAPIPGLHQERLTSVEALGWFSTASATRLSDLPIQLNRRGDEVFQVLIDSISPFAQPRAVEKDTSLDVYPYTLDRTRDEQTVLREEIYRLCLSGLDKSWERGDGTVVYESRGRRFGSTTDKDTFTDHHGFHASHSRSSIVNSAQVTANPRLLGDLDVVMYSLNTPLLLVPGATVELLGLWSDPNNPDVRVAAVGLTPLEIGIDYVVNGAQDGTSDVDLTPYVTITTGLSGNATLFTVTYTGPVEGWLTVLRQRGQPLLNYGATPMSWSDQSSIDTRGTRSYNVNMPYQASLTFAQEAAQYLVFTRKLAKTEISGFVRKVALGATNELTRSVQREISDRIAVVDTVSGISTSFFIDHVREMVHDGWIETQWSLSPAYDPTAYWYLEVVGRGELDINTRLGFGYVLGHQDIAFIDTHVDVPHADITHIDTHTDDVHLDSVHGDGVAHGDSVHVDTPAVNTAHSDIQHGDAGHNDSPHVDQHRVNSYTDITHLDIAHADQTTHYDHTDAGIIWNQNVHDDSHGDQPFIDHVHNDVPFIDEAHEDVPPINVAHIDVDHGDSTHVDTPHNDGASHTDIPLQNTAHGDVPHADTLHTDVTFVDDHGDVTHADIF